MEQERKLEQSSRWPVMGLGIIFVVAVGLVDYWTGEELSVLVLYLGPIALVSWRVGKGPGMVMAVASAVAWLAADLGSSHKYKYAQAFIPYWNDLMLLCFFLVIVYLLSALKLSYHGLEEKVKQRTAALQMEIAERRRAEDQLLEVNHQLSQSQKELVQTLENLKQSHEELKATQLQLIQAAKFESIGHLAAGVAHEVKNPLMIITMVADYLGNHVAPKDPDSTAMIEDMHNAIEKANRVIGELLEFSRPKELVLKLEDIHGVIDNTLSLVKLDLTRNRIKVAREFAPGLPALFLDRNKIGQVLLNLVMNAIQAMPAGGTLTVRTYHRSGAETSEAAKALVPASDEVIVEIDDTGLGIPEAHLPRIFDPFFTTKGPGKGTGLGLSVARQIIQLHGGSIELHNRPEGGARASLRFHSLEKKEHETKTDTGHR